MGFALKQRFNRPLPFRSGTGSDARLFFCEILYVPLFLVSYLFCSDKLDSFVRLFLLGCVFALFCLQFDRRKLTAGLYKLHRLLQFTRAVCLPLRLQAAGWSGQEKRVAHPMQLPEYRNKEIYILPQHGKMYYCGLLSEWVSAQ